MDALDGFRSTWSSARDTFGEGTPQTGEQYDKSGQLRQMQTTVESAAPGSRWSGTAASAYDTANTEHGKVFGKLADLDARLGAQVTQSSQIVELGRRNLEAVRQWVEDAAASVPEGKNRDQMLMKIARMGLGQLSEIVLKSNGDLNKVGEEVKKLGGEYHELKNQKFGPKEGVGDDTLGVAGEDDGKATPEDMEELTRKALAGDQGAAAKVDEILNGISDEQLGPSGKAHPLDPVQAELVGQMQAQMKPMSMDDLNAARERLGPNKDILANAMQVMSDPDVTYPRHDGDGLQVVPSTPGGPLPNDGVLPGDTGALPDGVQNTLNQRGDFSGPPDSRPGYPGSQPVDWEGAERTRAADSLKNLADIVGDGDPRFQQGSHLDREMMSNAKEWLAAQESPDGRSQEHWGDEVVERVFDTAGRDTVVNHDMLTTDKDFMQDVLTHEWQDDGQSVRTLTDWIDDSAYSSDPNVNARAGETASALADYLGDPVNKDVLMNNSSGSQPNMSLGQMNPELTQSLAQAMSPYVDEMAGRNVDGTSGWTAKDSDADLSYPHATNVMGVLGTDAEAARILDQRSASVQGAYVNEYANSVIDSNGQSSDSAAMEAAGRLKGISDEGAFLAASDVESDATKARQAAWDRMSTNYDAAVGLAGAIPHAGPALELQSTLMKDAILGPRPESAALGHTPIESSLGMRSALASTFLQHGFGNPADVEALQRWDTDGDGQLDIPPDKMYEPDRSFYQSTLDNYYSRLDDVISDPLGAYDQAYRDVIK